MSKRPRDAIDEFTAEFTTQRKLQLVDPVNQISSVQRDHIYVVGIHTLEIGGVVFFSAPLQVRSNNWGKILEVAHDMNRNTTRIEFTEYIHDPADIHAVVWYIPPTGVLSWWRLKVQAIAKQGELNKVSAVQISRNEIRPRRFRRVSEANILERKRTRLRKDGLITQPSPEILDLMAWADDSSYTNAVDVCLTSGSVSFFKRLDALIRKQPALTKKLIVYKGIKLGTYELIEGILISRKLAHMPMATTTDLATARSFAGDDGLVLEIELPVGEHVLDVYAHLKSYDQYVQTYIKKEKELLVPSGSSLQTEQTEDGIRYCSKWSVCMVSCTLIRLNSLRERVLKLINGIDPSKYFTNVTSLPRLVNEMASITTLKCAFEGCGIRILPYYNYAADQDVHLPEYRCITIECLPWYVNIGTVPARFLRVHIWSPHRWMYSIRIDLQSSTIVEYKTSIVGGILPKLDLSILVDIVSAYNVHCSGLDLSRDQVENLDTTVDRLRQFFVGCQDALRRREY